MKHVLATGLALLISTAATNAANLTFRIAGDAETFSDLGEQLQAASLTASAIGEEDTTRREIVAAAQADYARLLAVLFEAGYFGSEISIRIDGTEAAELPTIGAGNPVGEVAIEVRPNARFMFGRATIAPVPPETEIPDGFAPGEPAGTEIIRDTVEAGVDAWRGEGHAKAELAEQRITANHATDRLDAELRLAPGPRLRYGPIAVEGAEDVRARHIARIADLREGRVFDPDEVQTSASRLQRTGTFDSVSIREAEGIGPNNTLPMTITVAERLPRRFGFGAELSSDEGISTSAYWLHRNLTGYADSLRLEASVDGIGGTVSGGTDYGLTFGYLRPSTFNAETDLYVNGGVESLDEPNFSSDRVFIDAGARRIVSDAFEYSYGLGYEYSETDDALGTRSFSIFSLPLAAQYDRRDVALDPVDGYYAELGLRPFYGANRAGPGAVFTGDLRGYKGFGGEERQTVLAGRLQLGSVIGPDLEDVPASTLFFSGGGGTVRGQDYQSLGVELDDGDTVGGLSFVGLSAEIRQDVTENIGIVGFADFGLVSPDADFTGGDSHSGAGLGVRYNTGIGPLRVDLGFPVSGPEDDGGVGIYIGIGQAF
ncbi:autotransporter assembly complex family protein [uncultured Jannaschia sp.]|uniref:autotransporter assembly complex protein TamA n=1 Tax=uncultured Jannaschia sp. TaxID=293347 RepID=UPI002630B0B0|nr:autotransporter assembly complex family protein [uncultured Jannaschia sp.]